MKILQFCDPPTAPMARAFARFESQFTYPLGPGRSFRISHGDDHPRFFRAMGKAACFVAEHDGSVSGAVGVAIRTLRLPNGDEIRAAYIGDLKVDPSARTSRAFLRLCRAADDWARPRVRAAFGVVMDGTQALPADYTGRAGIEAFSVAGKIRVYRFSTIAGPDRPPVIIDDGIGPGVFDSLDVGRYSPAGGDPAERSEMPPMWLCHPDLAACGRLEDTRKAKRLIDLDNVEIRCAHLASFAWKTPAAAVEVIQSARWHAGQRGFDGLFLALPDPDGSGLAPRLTEMNPVIAPATVYAAGLPGGGVWNINSSEI